MESTFQKVRYASGVMIAVKVLDHSLSKDDGLKSQGDDLQDIDGRSF